ncbi:MAG: hypothetical protein HC767_04730 [Akkermansiaceae bacterium]|nr:hypothetical protein [Akkermansiaceae bacterium]
MGEDKGGEVFNGNSWRQTTNIMAQSILSDDPQGLFRTDNYPFLFAWTGNSGAVTASGHAMEEPWKSYGLTPVALLTVVGYICMWQHVNVVLDG